MHWIAENPWPLIIPLVSAAVIAVLIMERRGALTAAGLLSAAMLVFVAESYIVTPGETVEKELHRMLDAFKADDVSFVHSQISDDAPKLRETASRAIEMIRLHSGFHLKDIQIAVQPGGNQAVAHLRANGRATLRKNTFDQQVATRWQTTWTKHDDIWKLSEVKRLDVISGDEIGILDPR